jgi:hypothetical protein
MLLLTATAPQAQQERPMKSLKTITVSELIDLLEGQPRLARVIVSADYGDRGHTAQALPLRGEWDTVSVSPSSYSQSGFAIDEYEADDAETFLVIR